MEKLLRIPHIDQYGAQTNATPGLASASKTSKSTPTVTHFLQKGHSFTKKDTPPIVSFSTV